MISVWLACRLQNSIPYLLLDGLYRNFQKWYDWNSYIFNKKITYKLIQTYIYYFDSSFCKLWCWIKTFHGTSSYLFDNTSQDMDGYLNVLLNCLYHIFLYQWFYLNKSYFFHIWLIVYPVILAIIYALKITLYSIRIKFIRYYLLF